MPKQDKAFGPFRRRFWWAAQHRASISRSESAQTHPSPLFETDDQPDLETVPKANASFDSTSRPNIGSKRPFRTVGRMNGQTR